MATWGHPNNPTATNNPGISGSPTGTADTTPTIKLCSNNDDKHTSITICGYHFKPGTGVRLIAQLSQNVSKSGHPVSVDSHGNFQATWVFGNCKNFPLAVYAQDVDHPAEVSQKLRGSQLGSCSGQTGMQDNAIGKVKRK
jgi:hypothetical protein